MSQTAFPPELLTQPATKRLAYFKACTIAHPRLQLADQALCNAIVEPTGELLVFFYGPTEITEKALPRGTHLRIGGVVKRGSLNYDGSSTVVFAVTDLKHDIKVSYTGLLPDLFREGQGVVAEGMVEGPGLFHADTVLAKHDERYMPKDVADKLKQ